MAKKAAKKKAPAKKKVAKKKAVKKARKCTKCYAGRRLHDEGESC